MPTFPHILERQKPGPWALEQSRTPPDTEHLWRDLHLALPLWESAGRSVEDVSGLNLHSTAWGANTAWIKGELGPGLDFDGTTSSYVQIADPPANYLDGCTAFSVELWFETDDVSSYHGLFGKYRASTGMRSWRVYTYNANIEMQVSADGVAYENKRSTSDFLTTGTLFHVVVTYNAGVFAVYANGVSQSVQGNYTTATSCYAGTDYVLIGKRYDSVFFNGRIYSARFWQRALSAEEVAVLYELPFRIYEEDADFPSLAMLHVGSTPAGSWILAGEVDAGVEELYISGLENGVSYDVYAKTKDLSGNESTGCTAVSETPTGSTGGVWAPMPRGITVAPAVPAIARRYK